MEGISSGKTTNNEICFLCDETAGEEPTNKVTVTGKGVFESILSVPLREKFEELWRTDPTKVAYHPSCKLRSYNKSKSSSKKKK